MVDLALFALRDMGLLLSAALVAVLAYLLFFRPARQPVKPLYWICLALFFVLGVVHMFVRLLYSQLALEAAVLLVASNLVFMLGFIFFLQGPFWFSRFALGAGAEHSAALDAQPFSALATDSPSAADENPSPEVQPQLAETLIAFMAQQKPYLEPHITVERLALKLKVSPKLLSSTINNELQMNFFEMISHYRVNEAKVRLMDAALRDKPIGEIMKSCGFNSKSVFNQAFKKAVGLTPSHYRQLHLV